MLKRQKAEAIFFWGRGLFDLNEGLTFIPDHMNQTPEQKARGMIAPQLTACGWTIQNKSSINLHAATGVAAREYGNDIDLGGL